MGGYASRKSVEIVRNVRHIIAVELLLSFQSIDLLKLKPCEKLHEMHKKIRKSIPFVEADTYLGKLIKESEQLIGSNQVEITL